MYPSDNWTDKELDELEARIATVFKQAEKDLNKEVNDYFAKFKIRDKEMQKLVKTGDMTKAEYQQWRITQMGRGQRFEALRDKVAERYTKANEVANAYVNDATPSIYSLNRNYEAYQIEKAVGSCDFTMWDESTVRRLLVEQPDLMPYYPPQRALDRGIDLAYGKSQITKHVTSGIIRGLSPSKIASELLANLTSMNRASAVRAARTGITAAQNGGRMDSYVAAEKMGIQIKRRWVCTKDGKTRKSHGRADGQVVVGTKQPFIVGGYKMMFPADDSMGAKGHEIYNCRCTTRTVEKDGIEAEPREMRVRNPKWEEAKAEEDKLTAQVDKLKEREANTTDPDKRKQLRAERIKAQKELSAATKKRQGIDKNVVVNEMTYSEWEEWKKTGVKPDTTKKPAEKPKKEYLTEKKLKQKIADIDAEMAKLQAQNPQVDFTKGGGGYKHQKWNELQTQKEDYQTKLDVKVLAKQKKTLVKKQKDIQQQIDGIESNPQTYTFPSQWNSSKWTNITAKDWENLKADIPKKIKYFETKDKNPVFVQQLKKLDADGKLLVDLKTEMLKVNKELAQLGKKNAVKSNTDILTNALTFNNSRDAVKYHLANNFSQNIWDNVLTDAEREGIRAYTGSSYRAMNKHLRLGEHADSRILKYIEDCTKALNKTTVAEDVLVYRGMGSQRSVAQLFGLTEAQLSAVVRSDVTQLIGTRVVEKGFTSTAVTFGSAWSGCKLDIYLPSGTHAMYVDPISMHSGELELLLQRNATFEVQDIEVNAYSEIKKMVLILVEQAP